MEKEKIKHMIPDSLIPYTHHFCIHVPNFLKEVYDNAVRPEDKQALNIPMSIFAKYLNSIADRCSQINDPILNRLMVETTLYAVSDPENEAYDLKVVMDIINKAKEYEKEQYGNLNTPEE